MDLPEAAPAEDILAIDEALSRLAAEDPTKAELVKLRYFGGLSVEDAGRVLGISRATADRYWAYARVWLYSELSDPGPRRRRSEKIASADEAPRAAIIALSYRRTRPAPT